MGRFGGDDLRGRSEGDGPGETVFAYGYIKQLSAKIRENTQKCAKMRENARKYAKMHEYARKCAKICENARKSSCGVNTYCGVNAYSEVY